MTTPIHYSVWDQALCGERGTLLLAWGWDRVTCPRCRAQADASILTAESLVEACQPIQAPPTGR